MITLLFISTVFVGWAFYRYFAPEKNSLFDTAVISVILGSVCISWLSFLWVAILGYDTLVLLYLLIVLGWSTTAVRSQPYSLEQVRSRIYHLLRQVRHPDTVQRLLFFAALTLFFGSLFWTHYFEPKLGSWYSSGSAWGDLALHATQTHWFAYQDSLDLSNPIYAQQDMTYPFLVNFLSGLYRRFGASLQLSLWLSAAVPLIAGMYLLYRTVARYFHSHAVGILSIFLLCTTGTSAGVLLAIQDFREYQGTTLQFLQHMPNYAHNVDANMRWSNTINDLILPQRSFVFGFIVWVACAWLALQWNTKQPKKTLVQLTLLIGLLPFIHIHSFALLFGLLIWLGGWAVWQQRLSLTSYCLAVLGVIALATPQLWWQFSHTHSDSFVSFHLGWYAEAPETVLQFWLRHWGVYFLLLASFPILALKIRKLQPLIPLWGALAVLFVLNNIIQFQPHLYDNTKFLEAVQVFLCVILAFLLRLLWEKRLGLIVVAISLAVSSSGVLTLIRESTLSHQIVSAQEIAVSQELVMKTSNTDLFAVAPNHNHPALMVAGRKAMLGFPGWLWTHGINYVPAEAALKQVFAGGVFAESVIAEYGITHVYISDLEKNYTQVNEVYFAKNYPVVVASDDPHRIRVYAVAEKKH